jgi:hypothetical protein
MKVLEAVDHWGLVDGSQAGTVWMNQLDRVPVE